MSSNLLPGGNNINNKVRNKENAMFKDSLFSNKRNTPSKGFGCKYGSKCVEFNPSNYEKAANLKSLMSSFSENVLFGWPEVDRVFKIFLAEHPNYAGIVSPYELNSNAKSHFRLFLINRVSCSNGNLYDLAAEYFSTVKAGRSTMGSRSNNISDVYSSGKARTLSTNEEVLTNEYGRANINNTKAGRAIQSDPGGGGGRRHPGYKNTDKCQGMADAILSKKGRRLTECDHGGKTGYIPVGKKSKPFYCPDCRCWHCGASVKNEHIAACKDYGSSSSNSSKPSSGSSSSSSGSSGSGGGNGSSNTSSSNNSGTTTDTTTNNDTNAGTDTNNTGVTTDPSTGEAVATGYQRATGLYSDPEGDDPAGYKDRAIIVDETVWTEEELTEAMNTSGHTDVYGDNIDSLSEQELIPGFPTSDDSHKTRIFGLPLMYNTLADPNGRVFSETTMIDLPLVFIEPGRGIMNQQVKDSDEDALKKIAEDYTSTDTFKGIPSLKAGKDLRALSFSDAFTEYIEYFENLASIAYAHCGGKGIFKWSKALEMNFMDKIKDGGRSLVFFADTATSISDSFSNEFTQSQLVQKSNDLALKVREIKQLASRNASQQVFDSELTSLGADAAAATGGLDNLVSGILGGVARILNGSQILYPDIWNDSRMDKSYNISFKFFSPYGDKMSIFQHVYLPTIALMCMALPRMDSISGYAQPFYVRVNSPGKISLLFI